MPIQDNIRLSAPILDVNLSAQQLQEADGLLDGGVLGSHEHVMLDVGAACPIKSDIIGPLAVHGESQWHMLLLPHLLRSHIGAERRLVDVHDTLALGNELIELHSERVPLPVELLLHDDSPVVHALWQLVCEVVLAVELAQPPVRDLVAELSLEQLASLDEPEVAQALTIQQELTHSRAQYDAVLAVALPAVLHLEAQVHVALADVEHGRGRQASSARDSEEGADGHPIGAINAVSQVDHVVHVLLTERLALPLDHT